MSGKNLRGSLGKYLGSISGKNLRGITGETFVGYFEDDFGENIDHYILFVDINSQTNILKQNLKFILNLERVWENFKIWIFGMLHSETGQGNPQMDMQWSMPPRGHILPPPQPGMGYWPPPPWGYPTHPMGP
jgi:hypothetical protein